MVGLKNERRGHESRTEKSQHRNKRLALKRLAEPKKFKLWVNRMVHEITDGESLEQKVERMMAPENIKIEVKDEKGKWQLVTKEV